MVHHFNHSNDSSDNRATHLYQHVAPLGLGFFGDSGFLYTCRPSGAKNLTRECYLWKELFRHGIMARSQVTLDIEEPYGSSIVQVIHSFDLVAAS